MAVPSSESGCLFGTIQGPYLPTSRGALEVGVHAANRFLDHTARAWCRELLASIAFELISLVSRVGARMVKGLSIP